MVNYLTLESQNVRLVLWNQNTGCPVKEQLREHGGEFHHRDTEDTKLRGGREVGDSDVKNPAFSCLERLGRIERFLKRGPGCGMK